MKHTSLDIFSVSSEAIVAADEALRIIAFGKGAERIFGYSSDEVIGRPIDVLAPEGIFPSMVANGSFPAAIETEAARKDGSRFPAEASIDRLTLGGKPAYLVVLRDITRESLLRQSRDKFHTIFEFANDALFVADAESGIILDANKKAGKLLGMPPGKIVGMHQSQLHPEDKTNDYSQIFKDHIRNGKAVTTEDLYVCNAEGAWIPVEISSHVMELAGKKIILGIFRNLTKRKNVERELQNRIERQAALSRLGQESLAGWDIAPLMREAIRLAADALQAEHCSVLEFLPEENMLLLREGIGWKEGYVGSTKILADAQTQTGRTLVSGEPVIVEDFRETDFVLSGLHEDHGILSGITIPIHGDEHPFGVLAAHSSSPRKFTADDINFLQAICNILFWAAARKKAEDAVRYRLDFEKSVSSISSGFIGTANVDEAIKNALQSMGAFSKASRAVLFLFEENKTRVSNKFEWCAEGVPAQLHAIQSHHTLPWLTAKLLKGEVVRIEDVGKLPGEAWAEKEEFEKYGIKSVLALPLWVEGDVAGFVGFDNVEAARKWSDENMSLLKIASEMIGAALEQKRVEAFMLQSRHMWEDTFDTITDMITIHDRDYNIIMANKAAWKIFGLPSFSLEKPKCYKYYHGTSQPLAGCPSCQSLHNGKPATAEIFEPHLNMFVEIRAIPRLDAEKNIIGLIHIVRDITERKMLEEEHNRLLDIVTAAKNEWERTFDSTMELIALVDNDMRILRCNRKFADFMGKQVHEIVDSRLPEYFSFCRHTESSGEGEAAVIKTEVKLDEDAWFYVSCCPVYDDKGELLHSILSATDITALKTAQQRLEESEEELSKRVEELEKFYSMAVGRELRMRELKRELKRLKGEPSVAEDETN